jgi:hypothetical protein
VIEVINTLLKCLTRNSLKKKACPSLAGFRYKSCQDNPNIRTALKIVKTNGAMMASLEFVLNACFINLK